MQKLVILILMLLSISILTGCIGERVAVKYVKNYSNMTVDSCIDKSDVYVTCKNCPNDNNFHYCTWRGNFNTGTVSCYCDKTN